MHTKSDKRSILKNGISEAIFAKNDCFAGGIKSVGFLNVGIYRDIYEISEPRHPGVVSGSVPFNFSPNLFVKQFYGDFRSFQICVTPDVSANP